MPVPKRVALIIPGLGDSIYGQKLISLLTWHWRLFGIHTEVIPMNWRNAERFELKLTRVIARIDEYSDAGNKVSLVGTSAGASAAFNAFFARRDSTHTLTNVCGRLRVGPTTGFRSFAAKTRTSASFAESVVQCEAQLATLTPGDLTKVTTIRPLWDELVPPETVEIMGVKNKIIPTIGHMAGIGLSLILGTGVIAK